MRINTNVAALNSYNQLKNTQNNLSKSLSRLSSGKRINSAADDAAGLAISEKMNSQTKGLAMAQRNAQDGISMIQTAEGALKESHSILQRMRELSVQSANDTNTKEDRAEIQKEVNQLVSELDRIGDNTEFNTKNLLDGGAGLKISTDNDAVSNIQGTADTSSGTVSITGDNTTAAAKASVTGGSTSQDDASDNISASSTIGIGGVNYSFGTSDTIQDALDTINSDTATHGVKASYDGTTGFTLESNGIGSSYSVDITAAGTGDFKPTNFAEGETDGTDAVLDTTELGGSYEAAGNHVKVTSGDYKGLEFDVVSDSSDVDIDIAENNSLTLQIGANSEQNMSVSINDMRSDALNVDGLDVTSQDRADSAISVIDKAIGKVSSERSKLGAIQNRLDHTINNLNTSEENLTAAESRISDVDMAKEMMNMSKQQILSQAGTAMMAQANQLPQGVLQLLG